MSASTVLSPSERLAVPSLDDTTLLVPSPRFMAGEVFRSYGSSGRPEGWAWALTLLDPYQLLASGLCSSRLAAIQRCEAAVKEVMGD